MASTSRTFFASQPLFALVLGVFLPALPATAQDVLQDGSSVDGSFTVDQDLVVKGDTRTDTLEVDGLATLDSLSVRLPISQGAQITIPRDNDKNPVVALREIADETLSPGDLKEDLIHSLQKHVEVDEPEPAPQPASAPAETRSIAATAEAGDDEPVSFDRMSEEELLSGIEGLVPPEKTDDY